jgi:phosphoglycerate kinase
MKKITDITDLRGKRVIVRSSFNVPIVDGKVGNIFRIKKALATLRYLHEAGARVIVIGHIGRKLDDTLKPVYDELEKYFPFQWGGPITGEDFAARAELMGDGDLLLAENLRQDPREEANDLEFAKVMAGFADIYVNDAFDNAHREHASMCALAILLPAYAGLNLIEEVTQLEKVAVPTSPSLFLLGGAKFETKMPLVEKYLELYDHVFISGALMNDMFKAKGYEVGQSLVSDVSLAGATFLTNAKLILPVDVVVDGPNGVSTKASTEVLPDEKIMDCGPATVALLTTYINDAKTILWNGPFGNYEGGFVESTEATVRMLAEAEAFSVVGGGDTVAAIEKLGLNDQLGFVSTGGGAMLTYLEHGSTPALDLLK